MIGTVLTRRAVRARWAYSEMRSPRFRDTYLTGDHDVIRLHGMANAGTDFSALSVFDVCVLADEANKRRPVLQRYLNNIYAFRCEALAASAVDGLAIIPEMRKENRGAVTLAEYRRQSVATRATNGCTPLDPRAAAVAGRHARLDPEEPLVIGEADGEPILVDGYFRAIFALAGSSVQSRILAWKPWVRALPDSSLPELLREWARSSLLPGQTFDASDAVAWFAAHDPEVEPAMIGRHVEAMAVNSLTRLHQPRIMPNSGHDLFFELGRGRYRLWNNGSDPAPIYMTPPVLTP